MVFYIKYSNNVCRVACITMDSWKMTSSSKKTIKKDKDDLLKTVGMENVKATIFLTNLTFLTLKLTNYQSNLWYFCDKLYIRYFWLRYTMKNIELVQITLQPFEYVMYAGVTFPNDSCFMTLVASALKYFIGVILQQIHCSHGLNLGAKRVSSCEFRAALVSALISIYFILFDKVSQTLGQKWWPYWILGSFVHRQSISN